MDGHADKAAATTPAAGADTGSRTIVETFWKQSRTLSNGLTLSGYSRAADRSCFMIKEWKVFLDAGLSTYTAPAAIFITHSHCDHSFHLPMILVGTRDVPVYVPEPAHKWVKAHVEATYCMNQVRAQELIHRLGAL
jgi:ribonuclease Z